MSYYYQSDFIKTIIMKFQYLLFSALLLASCLFLSSSCGDDETGPEAETNKLTLNIKATYEGETFVTNKSYDYGGMPIQFSRLEFYVDELSLLQENGSTLGETEIGDIAFANLSIDVDKMSDAEEGVEISSQAVEAADYSGFSMGIGVSAELNDESWTFYAPGHPLRNDGFYWSSWGSFIFAKIEGAVDTDGDGQFESSFVYHAGGDTTYLQHQVFSNIDLNENDQNITLNIEVKELFKVTLDGCDENGDGLLDVETDDCRRSHSTPANIQLAYDIISNFGQALSVE